jgi:DNA-binding response OmpR family regulator
MTRFPRRKKTILVLDDEDIDVTAACQILWHEGYAVLEADCYKRAINVFESNRDLVDLLVADISLPDGDACDLALRVKDRQPYLRVLFVSGHVGAEVCRFYGLDQTDLHFLRKPFTAEQLIASVQRVFRASERFPRLHAKTRTA